MKPKNIRIVVRKKVNQWLGSIKDKHVRKLAEENTIVTGGSIASMLLGESVKDFDIYFRTKEAAFAVAQYYTSLFMQMNKTSLNIRIESLDDRVKIIVQSAGVASENNTDDEYQYFEQTDPDEQLAADYLETMVETEAENIEKPTKKDKYRPIFLSANAVTLSEKVQLVIRFFGEPDDIHRNYDFVHCTSYYSHWNQRLQIPKDALISLLSKELRYVGSKYPICSIIRLRKFLDRGWYITAGQILKCCWQISELDLSDPAVLEEQMTGVDMAYFTEVINALKERDDKRIDAAYLFELLDKIF